MRYLGRILALLTLSVATILLASCGQKQNCSGISFGGGSGGSSGGGSLGGGGSVCGPGNNGGGGGGGGGALDFLFYRGSLGASNAINTAELTATTFQILSGVSVAVGQSTTGNMVVVDKKFLYLPDQNSTGGVMGFAINHANGSLTAIGGSPFPAPHPVTSIAADPDSMGGRFLFVTDELSNNTSSFTIDPTTGVLTFVAGSTLNNPGFQATSLNVDGTGSYLYATAGASHSGVFGFSIDQTSGALTPIFGSPFPLVSKTIQVTPDGAWVISESGGAFVDITPIEAGTGALLTGSTTTFATVNVVDWLAIHPTGNFVYMCSPRFPVEGYQFSAGALTALPGSPYTTLSDLGGCQFDQNGTALFGILSPSNEVGVRIVDPATGAVAGGIPDLGVSTNNYFAVTN
jgi:hypothetical protein